MEDARKRSGRMAPLFYSNVEVVLHRSVGSLVQSRQVERWVCQLELLLSGRHQNPKVESISMPLEE